MPETGFLNYNGKILRADTLLISPNNRSFRYGDGFFETMKILKGKILLEDYHFERFFTSLELLQFEKPGYFTAAYVKEQILNVAKKNNHLQLARIRLMLFRGDGGLYDPVNHFPNYIIQTWPLNAANNVFNENGLVTGIYPDARKACDRFSTVKSNNYLGYAMAALWAKKNQLNDAILLNAHGRIADSTIANVFIVSDGIVKTPALTEGAVNGTMRRYLLKCMRDENIPVEEAGLATEDVLNASEIFFTNAIYGIRWVASLGNNTFTNSLSKLLHKKYIEPLFG